MPSRNLSILLLCVAGGMLAYSARDRGGHGRRFGELLATVERSYIETVDPRSLYEAAVDGVLSKLDENSRYVRPAEREEFEASLDLEFGGVGLELDDRGGQPVVKGLMPGSPAWRAGLAPGDRIVAIDGAATRGASLADAISRLRGRPGTNVLLSVAADAGADASAAAVRDVTLAREMIRIESVLGDRRRADGGWEWRVEGRPEVAHVRITTFGEHTLGDLESALREIEAGGPLDGLVLDLRGNPGGLVSAAVDACDLLLVPPAVIVSTRGRRLPPGDDAPPIDRRLATEGAMLEGVAIAVLVDEDTASAAEIVAACLQDHGRGTVIGGRTYGKGTVQQILPLLHDDGILKLTTSEYLRPNGSPIHGNTDGIDERGVQPTVGFEIAATRESLARLDAWRRERDAVRPKASVDVLEEGSLGDHPERIDVVLGRAVEWITAGRDAAASPQAVPKPEKNSPPRR